MTALDLPRDRADQQRPARRRPPGRIRTLILAVVGPLVLGYLVVATMLALVTAWVPGSRFSMASAFAVACPGWLVAYHVPISIHGAPFGVLPLLPTALVIGLVASSANLAARRLGLRTGADARLVVLLIAGGHSVVGVTLAIGVSGGGLVVDPPTAAIGCGLISATAAIAGLIRPCGLFPALFGGADESLSCGVRAGGIGLLALLAGGMAVTTLGLVLSFGTATSLFSRTAPGAAGGFGLVLLCAAYLPNAAVAGMSFLVGPGFSIGLVDLSITGLRAGPVPSVPLLAALPATSAGWWPVLLAVPASAGLLVGWWVRRISSAPQDRLRSVGVAAAVAAVGCFVLGELAGGRLGAGIFDPVQFPAGLFAVAGFCWIAVPGGAVAWWAGPRGSRAHAVDLAESGEDGAAVEVAEDGESAGDPADGLDGSDSADATVESDAAECDDVDAAGSNAADSDDADVDDAEIDAAESVTAESEAAEPDGAECDEAVAAAWLADEEELLAEFGDDELDVDVADGTDGTDVADVADVADGAWAARTTSATRAATAPGGTGEADPASAHVVVPRPRAGNPPKPDAARASADDD